MNDRANHVNVKQGMCILFLLLFLPAGCNTPVRYFENMAHHDIEYPEWEHGLYPKIQTLTALLSDEQREVMEREKKAVVIMNEGNPNKMALFPDAHHKGYVEGYAFCVATRYLRHRNIVITDSGGIFLHDGIEMSPLRKAYVEGWEDGQNAAWEMICKKPLTASCPTENDTRADAL